MRISDWSSDVCSSDLFRLVRAVAADAGAGAKDRRDRRADRRSRPHRPRARTARGRAGEAPADQRRRARGEAKGTCRDRKSVVEGKRGSGRVDLGGRRIIKTKKYKEYER